MSRINTNVSSLFAQNTLARTNDQLNTAMSRLSSGLRINSAADDPAGLIASEVLRAEMTGVSQAITNTDRANQLIQTADSALGQVSNLLNDIRGLVVEAANDGALSTEQIAANQLQVDSSLEAIDRIARTTQFGGKKLLDGSLEVLTSSVGTNIAELDVQQVNLGTVGGSSTFNITGISAAEKATLTDASVAVGEFTAGVSGSEMSFKLVGEDGSVIDNVNINFTISDNSGASSVTAASYDDATNVLTIDFHNAGGGANDADDVQTAIRGLSQFSASTTVTGGTAIDGSSQDARTLTVSGSAIGGASAAASSTTTSNLANRVQSRVVRISGVKGSEVFTFATGTKVADMVTAINSVTDSTGVVASKAGAQLGNLQLDSEEYGLDAFVDVEVISEGSSGSTSGTYGASTAGSSIGRDYGVNVSGNVNGVAASGKGNTLTVNSGVLQADIRLVATTTADQAFTVTGGGANFQLGSDVITPQQARMGIGSFSTGKTGGETGRLYQLRTGQNAALATDSITAGKIVDEAILSVANTRGRLGAFSATTLDSNKTALSDYLVNLTEAESALRDADFAKESAALTRAQVLVQSGTSILAIANQNPQNMLALLR